ncbi:MAG: RIP metalloprotease RseP [Chitinophagales bacterium]|nr:RIP metalloprotease RseP [Chitinophagales bacterium]
MNEVLIKAGQLILSLSILIVIHEMGHFMAARFFKTRVEKFYLFFNPWFSLFSFKRGETEYGMGWIPLGGYVKISGMIDESMDKEQLNLPPQPWEFRSKPAWQRLIIMLGGITMNVLLGIFIYWMILFFSGEEYIPAANVKYGIVVDSIGIELGLRNGDRIIAIDKEPVENFQKIPGSIIINMARSITVQRNGDQKEIPVSPLMIKKIIDTKSIDFISLRWPFVIKSFASGSVAKNAGLAENDQVIAINGQSTFFYDEVKKMLTANKGHQVDVTVLRNVDTLTRKMLLSSDGLMGVQVAPPTDFMQTKIIHYSLFAALPAGVGKAYETLMNYIKQFALIFSPKVQGYKHLGGFISIGNAFESRWDWLAFWSLTGFLSLALAFMNLLPIPALDGGHVLFTLYEMVTKRKPSEKFLEYAQVAGMILLFALLVFANGNDIVGLFR